MADVLSSVRKWLLTQTTVTNCVASRIYFDTYPNDSKLPVVTMSVISTRHDHTLSNLAGLAHTRVQFDCYANTRQLATTVAKAIRGNGLIAYKGDMEGLDVRGVRIEDGERHYIERLPDGSDRVIYAVNFDLMIDHTEEI